MRPSLRVGPSRPKNRAQAGRGPALSACTGLAPAAVFRRDKTPLIGGGLQPLVLWCFEAPGLSAWGHCAMGEGGAVKPKRPTGWPGAGWPGLVCPAHGQQRPAKAPSGPAGARGAGGWTLGLPRCIKARRRPAMACKVWKARLWRVRHTGTRAVCVHTPTFFSYKRWSTTTVVVTVCVYGYPFATSFATPFAIAFAGFWVAFATGLPCLFSSAKTYSGPAGARGPVGWTCPFPSAPAPAGGLGR